MSVSIGSYRHKRSLQRLLRKVFEIQEENKEVARSRKVISDILTALAKYPGPNPVMPAYADCPCQKSKYQ
jgi:hypothetical protein